MWLVSLAYSQSGDNGNGGPMYIGGGALLLIIIIILIIWIL